ncbi:MAG: ABC transporter ATP-binding protein [Vallitaleaceae bacterium]|nr:ABC transporter ATP-binding protein [Vallitaleaceae bacterium]
MAFVIETKNLSKSFKLENEEISILKDINLKINQGDFISIMGPSGSGKSTLLYLLGGLDDPSSGTVEIKGKELSVLNDQQESKMRRQDIGFVFQFYNLIPNLTVEENILLPALLDGKKAKDMKQELDEILEMVGLTDRRKHTPRELSGGQQQRVAIARSLINNPDVIMADEPIGNLDSKTGHEIMALFKRINQLKNKTIIQVTHDEHAATFGNKIIKICDGQVEEE